MGLVLDKEDDKKLGFFNQALSKSRGNLSLPIRYFENGLRKDSGYNVEVMLLYWLRVLFFNWFGKWFELLRFPFGYISGEV